MHASLVVKQSLCKRQLTTRFKYRSAKLGLRVNPALAESARVGTRPPAYPPTRRMYREGFTEFTREEISALGSLPLRGNSKFHLKVRSLPGVNPKPPFSPILDSTASYLPTYVPYLPTYLPAYLPTHLAS